jgi:hypothetical protein
MNRLMANGKRRNAARAHGEQAIVNGESQIDKKDRETGMEIMKS